ncbi:MAG: ABC transporter permease [Bacteroides sp.]
MKEKSLKDNIVQGINDLFYIWKQEFRTTFRDQGVLIFFVLVPLVYPLIYGFIYTNEVVREVPAVVVDASHTALSREYLRKVDATADVRIVSYCSDMEEAKLLMKDRLAYGIIYIPNDFSSNIVRGKQTQVSLYCDMSGLLYYKSLLIANTAVSLDMNRNIKIERTGNSTDRQDEITAYPIEYEDIALFNPTNGFAAFLIPAVLILLIQQTLLLGIGLSAGTARENNRFKDLVPINRHYRGTLRIVFGKGLSYFMVYALVAVYVLCIVPRLFSLNQIGQPATLTLFMLPYLAACIFFAMTASIAIRNRETCMLIFVFTSIPLLFISGISWPGSAIPAFWKGFSYLFPSTFGINGFVRINNMGATLSEVSTEYQALWLQAGFYFLTTCFVYRWQIIMSRKHVIKKYKALSAHRDSSLSRADVPSSCDKPIKG